jgi:predicted ABC-type ATPase
LKNKNRRPNLYVIAGPNGAGKTTFARKFLPQYAECLEFVNADLIAGGLSPFAPERAAILGGRLMLEQIHSLAERGLDFGFETTLSGKTYVKLLQEMKTGGYLTPKKT